MMITSNVVVVDDDYSEYLFLLSLSTKPHSKKNHSVTEIQIPQSMFRNA